MIFVISATLWVVPLYLAVTFLGYVINQLVATLLISTLSKLTTHYLHYLHLHTLSIQVASLGLYFKHLRSDVVYKNDSLARNGYQPDV